MPNRPALGLIETRGLVSAIEAADAAAKAANVVLTSVEVTVAALVTIKMEGELGAVAASVEAGAAAAQKVGELVSAHVIPRPDDELDKILPPIRYLNPAGKKTSTRPRSIVITIPNDDAILEAMTVVDLRRIARAQKDFPMVGREISHANKEELIGLLKIQRSKGESA